MKQLELPASQLIVPSLRELNRDSMRFLQIYFKVISEGAKHALPPCLVTSKDNIEPDYLKGIYVERSGPDEFYQRLMEAKAQYLLLDGNHKSIAYALCNKKIRGLELQHSEDIGTVIEMVERGELFDLPRQEETLEELANRFIDSAFNDSPDGNIITVEGMVEQLIFGLPDYMVKGYKKPKRR